MFVAIRDILFAKGRFALMGAVVALITLLTVLLSGLTAGLANESTSAVANLPASHVAFGATGDESPEQSFSDSSVTDSQVRTWADADGVEWAEPLGITQTRLELGSGETAAATVFAAQPGGELAPEHTGDGEAVIGQSLVEEENLETGDAVTISGEELTIAAVRGDDQYSHTPAVWTSLDTWQSLAPAAGGESATAGTVVATDAPSADTAAIDEDADTVSATRSDSLQAIGAFSSENGSLLMIQGFLYAISALVIGAFLTVWTIQRTGDIAILKALGGSTAYLLRDALAQALLVLVAGTGLGGAIAAAIGTAAEGTVPFELTLTTTVLPVAGMAALGMAGSVLAVGRITSVDPLTALGGAR